MGKGNLFYKEEEEEMVEHIVQMAQIGYGYSKSEMTALASSLAVDLGRKDPDTKLSNNMNYGFLRRWSDRLSAVKPRELESTRAAAVTEEVIQKYFQELANIISKYNLTDKPHLIYNLDETGLQTNHRPHKVVAAKGSKPQAITSPRSGTATLIACANAVGSALPPYFIFKGKQLMSDLLKGALPGTGASMSDSGWSNGEVFKTFLEDHFLKYAQHGSNNEKVLLLYDGHASHISLQVIKWAQSKNIILFVLPPYTSHILQPLDVGCFGPFKSVYYSECSKWMADHRGEILTRFNICQIACQAYTKAMSMGNILSAFRKTGIYPLDNNIVPLSVFKPAESFAKRRELQNGGKELVRDILQKKMDAPFAKDITQKQKPRTVSKRPRLGDLQSLRKMLLNR